MKLFILIIYLFYYFNHIILIRTFYSLLYSQLIAKIMMHAIQ